MIQTVNLNFIKQLNNNIKRESTKLQVILGPRQVGKTTTLLHLLEKHYKGQFIYYSADEVFNFRPDWLLEICADAVSKNKMIAIDEIQKCENWAETIKIIYDQYKKDKKKFQCVLLGSSSLQTQKGLTESLTGRFEYIQAFHWNYEESKIGYGLTFDEYLKYGGYPGSYDIRNTSQWKDYVKRSIILTVIEKDILQYNTVKSPALFKQAFEILMAYPAQEISYTKLLGQLQDKGNTDLIKYYISLYEGAFLIRALEKYHGNTLKIKSSSPKILPTCPALYYLSILDEYSPAEKGHAFELTVGIQLLRTGEDLYYWREDNKEVDFILKRGKKLWAIEVKSGQKKSTSGILEFKEKFSHAKAVIITPENYFEFELDPLSFLESHSF